MIPKHPIEFAAIRGLVKSVLQRPTEFEWSYQGLGMLRMRMLEVEGDMRIHVWMPSHAEPGVSTIHTHPWHFESLVVSGTIQDVTYFCDGVSEPTHSMQVLRCGEGCELLGEPKGVHLEPWTPLVTYRKGQTYCDGLHVVHESRPSEGAVTVVRRVVPEGSNPDQASVFWPIGEDWVSAEPRPATPGEVRDFAACALSGWGVE